MSERREYHESTMIVTSGPFGGDLIRAEGALCPDGKRRNAHRSSKDGIADTFFSIPAFVYVGRKRVYGYIGFETMSGFSVATEDDPTTIKFHPYLYRKNHRLVMPKRLVKVADIKSGDIVESSTPEGKRVAAYVSFVGKSDRDDRRTIHLRSDEVPSIEAHLSNQLLVLS